jgi:hypothetical protein
VVTVAQAVSYSLMEQYSCKHIDRLEMQRALCLAWRACPVGDTNVEVVHYCISCTVSSTGAKSTWTGASIRSRMAWSLLGNLHAGNCGNCLQL